MRYFQNACDTVGWFSISNDLLQAAENLESRLMPCVELMSGRSAAALMPDIVEGLTPEEVAELQQLSQPIGGNLDGGTTSALTTLEVDGMPHTIVKVVEKRWRGHTAAVDNDIVGVDSLDVLITTHSAHRMGGRVFVDVGPQASATARGSVKTLTIPPLDLGVMRQSISSGGTAPLTRCPFSMPCRMSQRIFGKRLSA